MAKFLPNYELTVESFAGPVVITPPFTLEFDVVRSTLKSAGHASFRIYNLADTTRNNLRKDINLLGLLKEIRLRAGYGKDMPLIFRGNVSQGWSAREGNTNMITNLKTYDGAFGIINSESNNTVQRGSTLRESLTGLIGDLEQIRAGKVGSYYGDDGKPVVFGRGLAVNGNTADLLDEFSRGGFFVDLETAHCLADHECLKGSLDVLDSSHGLLGTPILEQNRLTFDIIFEPKLLIAQRLILNSVTAEKFNGEYKVLSLRHRGTISETVDQARITTLTLWRPGRPLAVVT